MGCGASHKYEAQHCNCCQQNPASAASLQWLENGQVSTLSGIEDEKPKREGLLDTKNECASQALLNRCVIDQFTLAVVLMVGLDSTA